MKASVGTPDILHTSLTQAFTAQVARHPGRVALHAGDGRSWSYAALQVDALSLARELRRQGVGRGDRVAVLGGRAAETVVALLAVLHAGAAYCVIDPLTPTARRELILADLSPAALITAGREQRVSRGRGRLATERGNERRCSGDADPAATDADPHDVAYILYTSGSTGVPKGVMVEHHSVLNMLRSYEQLAPASRGFAGALLGPIAFDVTVWEIFSTLLYGGTLHVPPAERLADGDELWHFLRGQAIDSAYIAPGLLAAVVDAAEETGGRLSRVLVGVEPIPQGMLDRFRRACPGLRVVNAYGPTETTVVATLHLLEEVTEPGRRTPIGRPVLGSRVVVVDEDLRSLPPGEVGEIVVSGVCLARGYLSGDCGGFIDSPAGRSYRTGDYGRLLPDGTLEFTGRNDGQLKINGFRVEIGDVETALNSLPGVRRCAVLVTGKPGEKRLTAAVEAAPGLSAATVRGELAERLPSYAVPPRILTVPAFPLTANGKVDVRALLATDSRRPLDAPPYAPPRNAWEEQTANCWSRVLGIEEIGIDDDFNAFGGTSLDAVRIAAELRRAGRSVSASAILSARTIRALAVRPEEPRTRPAAVGTYPATRAQEGLWAWRELHPDAATTTVVHVVRLDGPVELERLRNALSAVVARHEALRTTFHLSRDRCLEQRVAPPRQCSPPTARVGSEAEVERRIRQLSEQRFDVGSRPWSAEVLLGPRFCALLLAADHMVLDGESTVLLQRDLTQAYGSAASAVAGPAATASLTTPTPERRAVLDAYWRDALATFQDRPALPEPQEADHGPRRVERLERGIPDAVWRSVEAIARRAGTTPFVVVLAAFKAFLRQRSDSAHNTVSIAVSRRHALGCPEALGHFVNLVPICDQVSGSDSENLSFDRYLAAVAARVRDCIDHSDLPFEDMLAHAPGATRAGDATPARVVMVQRLAAPASVASGGVRLRTWPGAPSNAPYDLTLFLSEGDRRRPARMEWLAAANKALAGSLERTADAFCGFLEAAASRPASVLAELPSLSSQEEDLVAATATASHAQGNAGNLDLDLVQLFADQVRLRPEAVAVTDDCGRLTYRELDRRAAEIAACLPQADCLPPGACLSQGGGRRPVLVVVEKSSDLLAALLAVLRSGAPYLPLSPEHARTRLPELARQSCAVTCVTTSATARLLDTPSELRLVLLDRISVTAASPAMRPGAPVGPDTTAYVMPTSGSTGIPKLVAVPHRAVARLVYRSRTLPLDHRDRTMLIANSSFDAATFEIWGALVNGGRVVVPPDDYFREPARLCAAIEEHGVTAGFFTTTLFERLVEAAPERLAGMRHVIVGGEVVPPRLFAQAARHLPHAALVNGYGPTENTTFSCCYRLDRDSAPLRSVPIGPPVSGSGAFIADSRLRLLPPGVPGEILVTGAGLAHGYLNDPELTASRFPGVPALGGVRAYRTGDLGRLLMDGSLEYLGRLDQQLKVRGFRIEPGEVESVLCEHPAVRRAAAYAAETEGGRVLFAAVEADGVSGLALRDWMSRRVPSYLLPARIQVVESFPMTANGKLDQVALRATEEPPVPAPLLAAACTPTQQAVARVWSELLSLPGIGLDEDVFDQGANSMMVLTASTRLSRNLRDPVPTHLIYAAPTVRALAARIDANTAQVPVTAATERASRLRERAERVRRATTR